MPYTPEELASRLKEEGNSVLDYLQQLAPEQWDLLVYPPGDHAPLPWQMRDLLAHFIAAEQGFQELIASVAAGDSGVIPGFDVDEYNQRTVAQLRGLEPDVLLGQYAMVRERTVALVSGLSAAQLAQTGRHPAAGEVTLSEMVRIIYNHNKLHLRDARRALQAGSLMVDPGPQVPEEGRG